MELKAGTYYVGDLSYVLREENGYDWDAAVDILYGDQGIASPEFQFGGVKTFCSNTTDGEGIFRDNLGRRYPSDASLIGVWPMDKLPKNVNTVGGHVITFFEDFECGCDDLGNIYIGNITIMTGSVDDEHGSDYGSDEYKEGSQQ